VVVSGRNWEAKGCRTLHQKLPRFLSGQESRFFFGPPRQAAAAVSTAAPLLIVLESALVTFAFFLELFSPFLLLLGVVNASGRRGERRKQKKR
jgi:hypothetical protein